MDGNFIADTPTYIVPTTHNLDQRVSGKPSLGKKLEFLLTSLLLATTLIKNSRGRQSLDPDDQIRRPPSSHSIEFINLPVQGNVTQGFHSCHIGIDTCAPIGTPVHATMDGLVAHAGWNNAGYGNLVVVQNGEYSLYYAHLSEILVNVGQKVSTGMTIGYSGSTGNSTGPHLHYEVRINNIPVDPLAFHSKIPNL